MFRKEIHKRRIIDCLNTMSDTLGTQLTNCLPDTVRTSSFTGMNGDVPTRITCTIKVTQEQTTRETEFVTGKVKRSNAIAMCQQGLQLSQT